MAEPQLFLLRHLYSFIDHYHKQQLIDCLFILSLGTAGFGCCLKQQFKQGFLCYNFR